MKMPYLKMLICAFLIKTFKCNEAVNSKAPDYDINFDNLAKLGYDIVLFEDRDVMVSLNFSALSE